MSAIVSFVLPSGRGYSSGIGRVVARENVTVPGTTTRVVQPGEMVIVGNTETGAVAVAFGASAPNADNTGFMVPSGGVSYPILPNAGDVINVKAIT